MKRLAFFNDGLRSEWSLFAWRGLIHRARARKTSSYFFDGNVVGERSHHLYQNNLTYALVSPLRFDALVVWHGVVAHFLDTEQARSWYRKLALPTVLVEGQVDGMPRIEYDNAQGIEAVVDHLHEVHGYRRIGFVGMYENHPGFEARYRGFRAALERRGLTLPAQLDKPWWTWGDEQTNGAIRTPVLDRWLTEALQAGAQALVCVADIIAIQVVNRLEALGFRVPEDVAVTGFDGFAASLAVIPPLTTVRPDWQSIGRAACDLALDLLQGSCVAESQGPPVDLLVRQSCGCQDATAWGSAASVAPEPGRWERTFRPPEGLAALLDRGADWSPHGWLAHWDRSLRRQSRSGGDLLSRHALVWQWEAQLDALVADPSDRSLARRRLAKTRVLVGTHAEHAQLYQQYRQGRRIAFERRLEEQMVTKFRLPSLARAMAEDLPGLGIPAGWVVVFDDPSPYRFPEPPPARGRLIIAFDETGLRPLPEGGVEFDTVELVPPAWFSESRPDSYLIRSLHVEDRKMGYIVYKVGTEDGAFYASITGQIAVALQGSLLVRQVEDRARELAENWEELQRSQQQLVLQEKRAVLGAVVAGIAHELNTPLGVAVTGASFLSERIEEFRALTALERSHPEELDRFATDVVQSAQLLVRNLSRASELIAGLDRVSREVVEGGARRFRLRERLLEAVRTLRPHLERVPLQVDVLCPAELEVIGPEDSWGQVLQMLLVNSATHGYPSGRGGRATFLVETTPAGVVLLYGDDGVGLDATALAHLFEPFSSSLENKGGVGLGTYLLYTLITRRLGGHVEATSAPGHGLHYRIELPPSAPGANLAREDERRLAGNLDVEREKRP